MRQIRVKALSNAALFELLKKALQDSDVTETIITPRIDKSGYGYYWIGVRRGITELDFKLVINQQIIDFVLAYLAGEELPDVTKFDPDERLTSQEECEQWLEKHRDSHMGKHLSCREEIKMSGTDNYLALKVIFKRGKIIYPATKIEDVLSLFSVL